MNRDCVECGVPFVYERRRGPPPQRCPPCRTERARLGRVEISRRHREADPDRAREQWNRSNRKRLADPEFVRQRKDVRIFKTYGITRDQLNQMIEDQGGKCLICEGGPNGPGDRLHIDHCHDGGHVRGLLCGKCNTAVGLLDNDPDRAESLARYLRR